MKVRLDNTHEVVINLNYTKQLLIFRYYTKLFVADVQFEIVINMDFYRISRIYRLYGKPCLSYKLLTSSLKVKHPIKSTLCLNCFRNIVSIVTKRQNKKTKIGGIYFFSAASPSLSGWGCCCTPPPTFSRHKFFISFFHLHGCQDKG